MIIIIIVGIVIMIIAIIIVVVSIIIIIIIHIIIVILMISVRVICWWQRCAYIHLMVVSSSIIYERFLDEYAVEDVILGGCLR